MSSASPTPSRPGLEWSAWILIVVVLLIAIWIVFSVE